MPAEVKPEIEPAPDVADDVDDGGSAPALTITLDDTTDTFKAYPAANQMLLVKYVDDIFRPGYPSVKAVTLLALDQALPEERERLEAFLTEHGRSSGYTQALYDGLEACWRGETTIPLGSSSDSSDTTSTTGTEPLSTGD